MQVMVSRTHTGSMSAFAAFAAQVCNEPESPPALSLQPILTRVAQLQPCQDPLEAKAAHAHTLLKDLRRAATAPYIAPAVTRISPWAAMDAPASASAVSVAAPLPVATVACQSPEPAPFYTPSKEEHRAQLVQLLEDACRQALNPHDWRALASSDTMIFTQSGMCESLLPCSSAQTCVYAYLKASVSHVQEASNISCVLTMTVAHAGIRVSIGRC